MTTTVERAQPAYGNWVRPRSPGLGPLGVVSTTLLFAGIIVSLLMSMALGATAALVSVAVFAVPVALAAIPMGGRTLGTMLVIRAGWWRRRARHASRYRTGPLSRLPAGSRPLPGVLASTRLLEPGGDGQQDDVGVIYRPGTHLYTVVLRCQPDGMGLVERDVVDLWVAGYGGFLEMLGQEPGLRAATVVVDTAPDPGTRLSAEYQRTLVPSAPEMAREVMAEVVRRYPAASSDNIVYVALTYAGSGLHRRPRDTDGVRAELLRRLPGLRTMLEAGGGGTVEVLSRAELPAVVRAAYDPAVHLDLSAALADGEPIDLGWEEAGPVATVESWDAYRHDSGTSVTWEMAEAPRGTVFSDVLRALAEPHTDFLRKRVALIYRPHDPAEAAKITQGDANTMAFTAANGNRRVTAINQRKVEATQGSEREVAAGAGLTRFALMVTATVGSEDELQQAVATIERLGRLSRLRLRRSWGQQAAAFAMTLPVGFVPWEHTMVPPDVRAVL